MLYAIYAYEEIYSGLHGINYSTIEECNSLEEAKEATREYSLDVMETYHCIMNELYGMISEECEEETEEWYEALEELMEENVDYEIYLIRNTKSKSFKELLAEFINNKEEFVKTYCKN